MKNLWIGMFSALMFELLFLLIVTTIAKAHPADDPCPPTQYVSFGCQIIVPHLGLTNPTMFKLNREYWHVRRTLEGELKDYAICVGAVNERRRMRGAAPVAGEPGCMKYHEVIPATPIIERPNDLKNAQNQIDAANLTFYACSLHRYFCEKYLQSLR